MLQFYLRAEGLALSWVGTGRLIFRIDLPDDAFAEISRRIVAQPPRCIATAGGGARQS